MDSLELTKHTVQILDRKKAEKIDYFVIASATNTTHVRALADELEFELKKLGRLPRQVEGVDNASWIILDYQDVIVHVFYEETRNYYNLEKLWGDGVQIPLEELLAE